MFNISQTAKKMVLIIGVIFLISLVSSAFYYRNINEIVSFGKGLTLGSLVAAIKVILIENTLDKVLDMDQKQAQNQATLGFLFRLIITTIVLVFSGISENVNLWGTIIGLFSLQISAYVVNFFFHKQIKESRNY